MRRGRLGGKAMRRALRKKLRSGRETLRRIENLVQPGPRTRCAYCGSSSFVIVPAELLWPLPFPGAAALLKKELIPLQRDLGDLHDGDVWWEHWSREARWREGESREAALTVARAADAHRRKASVAARRRIAHWQSAEVGARV